MKEGFRDLRGVDEDATHQEREHEKKERGLQLKAIEMVRSGKADLSGSLVVKIAIPLDALKELIPVIDLRYDGLNRFVAPVNRYLADLVFRDCGVTINKRDFRGVDPLCMSGVVEGLVRENPFMWDDHQVAWLKWRSQGRSLREIVKLTIQHFPEETKPDVGNLSRWFNSIREKVFHVRLGQLHFGSATMMERSRSKEKRRTPPPQVDMGNEPPPPAAEIKRGRKKSSPESGTERGGGLDN